MFAKIGDNRFAQWCYDHGLVPSYERWQLWEAATAAEREFARTIIQRVRGYYPESVFLPDSDSIDAKSACWARQVCDNILEELEREWTDDESNKD